MMTKELQRFTVRIIILTVILAGIGGLVFGMFLPQFYFESFPLTFAVFIAVSYISHRVLVKSALGSPVKFNMAFMVSFILKLFAYGLFVAAVLFSPEEHKVAFTVWFLVLYFSYTAFDVNQILGALKRIQPDSKKEETAE
ncbi:MAG: hypothetical protein U9N85_05920 [Bacteroidota bacterium]|nr:hypothetical protein [Bacteroidota bacterium]